MSFANKVVFVTGASSGIGAATAIEFAKEGAHVVMVARDEIKMKNVCEQFNVYGEEPLIIKADISKDEEATAAITETISKYGKLDILVNNAGRVKFGQIRSSNFLQLFDEIMAINLRAAVNLTSLAAPYLIKTKGNIVNISSISGTSVSSLPQSIPYCVSKAGLDHFTRGAALELAEYGVRVNAISPGPVDTDIVKKAGVGISITVDNVKTALKRVSDAVEVADLILYLSSDKAKSITGSNYVIDNGSLLDLER